MASPVDMSLLDFGPRARLAPTTTTLLLSILGFALWRLYLALLPKPIPGIPHNPASARSIFGDIPGYLRASARTREPITWLLSQARATGSPISQIFLAPFGGRPFVMVTDFRETQDILVRRGKEFDRSSVLIDTLGVALPHHHIVRKTDAGWRSQRRLLQDMMLPKFLHNVAAPNICASVTQLVGLWRAKTDIASGRPFTAEKDIYYAALDAVLEFTFGASFAHRAVKPQLDAMLKLDQVEVRKLQGEAADADKPVEFVDAPLHETVVATLDSGDVIEDLQSSPFPRLMLWWKKKNAKFVKTWDTKNQFLEEEILKAVARMEKQTEASDESWVMSAVDHIVHRERLFAEKDGREPDYLSPVIRDEVRCPPTYQLATFSPRTGLWVHRCRPRNHEHHHALGSEAACRQPGGADHSSECPPIRLQRCRGGEAQSVRGGDHPHQHPLSRCRCRGDPALRPHRPWHHA